MQVDMQQQMKRFASFMNRCNRFISAVRIALVPERAARTLDKDGVRYQYQGTISLDLHSVTGTAYPKRNHASASTPAETAKNSNAVCMRSLEAPVSVTPS